MQCDTISLQRYSLPGGLTVFWRTSSDTILTISSRSTCFANFDSIDSPVIQFDDPNQYKVEEVAAKVPLGAQASCLPFAVQTPPGCACPPNGTSRKRQASCLPFAVQTPPGCACPPNGTSRKRQAGCLPFAVQTPP